jgi:DNA replication protein DnaC
MNREQTVKALKELRLTSMADSYLRHTDEGLHRTMTCDDFLALLVEEEIASRKTKRFNTMVKKANLRPENACFENIRIQKGRGFGKTEISELKNNRWIDKGRNIILSGPTGVGKTFLSEALIFQGCKLGYRGKKCSLPVFLEEIRVARATGTYIKYLKSISHVKILVLDDFLISKMNSTEAAELLTVLEERVARNPTIVTSQYPTDKWYERIIDPTIADALCDRLLEGSFKIKMDGSSQRGK